MPIATFSKWLTKIANAALKNKWSANLFANETKSDMKINNYKNLINERGEFSKGISRYGSIINPKKTIQDYRCTHQLSIQSVKFEELANDHRNLKNPTVES